MTVIIIKYQLNKCHQSMSITFIGSFQQLMKFIYARSLVTRLITDGQSIFNRLNTNIKRANLQLIETIETLNNHPLTILKVSFADIVKKDIGEIGCQREGHEIASTKQEGQTANGVLKSGHEEYDTTNLDKEEILTGSEMLSSVIARRPIVHVRTCENWRN